MSRPGVVFSREQLLDAVWGHDRAVTDRTVDVYILRLRQKIEADRTSRPSSAACAVSATVSTRKSRKSEVQSADPGPFS